MMMPSSDTKVLLCLGVTDMRKSINGLSVLVEDYLEQNPFSGHMFVFCNRKKDILKILYWDRNGFCLWQKRLEKHRFIWPSGLSEAKTISQRELFWLLDGIDLKKIKAHEKVVYSRAS